MVRRQGFEYVGRGAGRQWAAVPRGRLSKEDGTAMGGNWRNGRPRMLDCDEAIFDRSLHEKTMSTAVLISGQMRTFASCVANQNWMVFRKLKDPYFFIS